MHMGVTPSKLILERLYAGILLPEKPISYSPACFDAAVVFCYPVFMRVLLPYRESLCLGQTGPFCSPLFPRVYLSAHEREKHLYVLGITGKGKSKFLEYLIVQDIMAGRGCGVIDPHSDLTHPQHLHRIVYLDMTDDAHVPDFNVLAVPGQPYAIAQLVIEAFRRTWPEALKEAHNFPMLCWRHYSSSSRRSRP